MPPSLFIEALPVTLRCLRRWTWRRSLAGFDCLWHRMDYLEQVRHYFVNPISGLGRNPISKRWRVVLDGVEANVQPNG